MDLSLLYSACVLGAVGLYVMMRPAKAAIKWAGAILALAAGAWLVAKLPDALGFAPETRPPFFFWVFAIIAVAAAGRMITHPRPVYSALYFIMVVLSSAAIFLLLEAEFMAFALVIVYAGAILVTYLFVIMLAQQAQGGDDPAAGPEYDRNPREPAAAAVVGLLILAMLSQATVQLDGESLNTRAMTFRKMDRWLELQQLPGQVEEYLELQLDDEVTLGWSSNVEYQIDLPEQSGVVLLYTTENGLSLTLDIDRRVTREEAVSHIRRVIHTQSFAIGWSDPASFIVTTADATHAFALYEFDSGVQSAILLPEDLQPDNIQQVGLALVSKFPVSLEVAGVILLMAMFGAVVLARRQIELGEDELRQAAGMQRLPIDSDVADETGGGS